jgi:hypothetical protein
MERCVVSRERFFIALELTKNASFPVSDESILLIQTERCVVSRERFFIALKEAEVISLVAIGMNEILI